MTDLPVLDPDGLENLLAITGGDHAFVEELIETYLADAAQQVEALRRGVTEGDHQALIRPAHSLKGTSLNVGALGLAETCRAIEADARSGDVPDADARIARVEAEMAAVSAALAAALQR